MWQRRVDTNTTSGTTVFFTTDPYADYLWVAGAAIVDAWASIDGASSAPGCEDINTVLTDAFLSANASDPLSEALFEAYSTAGYVSIDPGEYDAIEETGCDLELIEVSLQLLLLSAPVINKICSSYQNVPVRVLQRTRPRESWQCGSGFQ